MNPILMVFLIVALFTNADAAIVSKKTEQSCQYVFEAYYENSATTCSAVIAINVGTGMSVNDYTELAKSIVAANTANTSTVAIIVDNNPGCLFNVGLKKDDGAKFARVVNKAMMNLRNDIPICTNPLYFIGGHSGGGKGAMIAIQMGNLNFSVAGYVGLDPYQITQEDPIPIRMPSLFWGFNKTTCAVNIDQAAKAGYNDSNSTHRLFYQVQTNHDNKMIGGPHCSFTNKGCFRMCKGTNLPWIKSQVATTFHRFASAVLSQNFDKGKFVIEQNEVILYANLDQVPEPEPEKLPELEPALA
jgi:hypothetical protein